MKAPQKIVNPQQWPHVFAPGEPKLYNDLSVFKFCSGYLVIITQLADNPFREPVIAHFHELMILASTYQWSEVRSYHYKFLRSIELGLVQWGDSFEHFKCLLTEAHHKASKSPTKAPNPTGLPSHATKFATHEAGMTTVQ